MRIGAWMIAVLFVCMGQAWAFDFPVKDAQTAIAIAKKVCRGKAAPSLKWQATLDSTGKSWGADTAPSVCSKATSHMWSVEIPVNGPYPKICRDSGYELICNW